MNGHSDTRASEQVFSSGSLSQVSEPLFIRPLSSVRGTEVQLGWDHPQNPEAMGIKNSSYCPGEMLSKGALMPMGLNTNAMCALPAIVSDGNEPEAESDCSTADTLNDAMASWQIAAAEWSTLYDGSTAMIPSFGMGLDTPWPECSPHYWMQNTIPACEMPIEPAQAMHPRGMPINPSLGWPHSSAGSGGHRLGRCKPCAFLYKGGCLSGVDCQYCHLCPPGEKQRRKRVMLAMQRNCTTPTK